MTTDNAKIDAKSYPETAKFLDWYADEQEKGLVDIKFFTNRTQGADLESFFAEVNAIIAAPAVNDPEIF